MRGGNVSINDLPRLPKYQDSSGGSTICWTNVLRGCRYKDCPFKPQGGHVARNDITDGFADAVCDKLGKGVMYIISQEHGECTAKKWSHQPHGNPGMMKTPVDVGFGGNEEPCIV